MSTVLQNSLVVAFVRRFHVHIHKIATVQKIEGRVDFSVVVGVDEPGDAVHVQNVHGEIS